MKQIFLFSLYLISINSIGSSQTIRNYIDQSTNLVTYTEVVNLDSSYTSENIYSITKEWITTNNLSFNRFNDEKHGNGAILLGVYQSKSDKVELIYKNESPLKLDEKQK